MYNVIGRRGKIRTKIRNREENLRMNTDRLQVELCSLGGELLKTLHHLYIEEETAVMGKTI